MLHRIPTGDGGFIEVDDGDGSSPSPAGSAPAGGTGEVAVGDLGVIYQSPAPPQAASGGGSTGSTPSPVGGTSSPFVINVIYDSSVNSAPAGFVSGIQAAVSYLESVITTAVTVNIDVGYGEIAGQSLGANALGESETFLDNYSYSSIKTALANVDPSAAANLPASAPGSMWLATAEAKALGLAGASSNIDGYAGFSSSFPFAYDPNNRAVSGEYDFIGVVEHEFTEDMGRIDLFGATLSGGGQTFPDTYSLLDLYHYTSPGVHTYTGTSTNYFSVNNGATDLDNFNSNPGGDLGDWAGSAGSDSFLAFSPSDEADVVSPADIAEINALGYALGPTISFTATSADAVQGGAAVALLSAAPVINDTTSTTLTGATIRITNGSGAAVAGDKLFVAGLQSGTISGVTVGWNATTNTLTLTGTASIATYQTLLSEVTYQDTGTDASTGSHPARTVTWSANDGAHTLTVTSQVTIDRAPVANNDVAFDAPGVTLSVNATNGVLANDTDADGDSLTVSAVAGSAAKVGVAVAGADGRLTLNANGSYTYVANSGVALGSADSFTYTVSDGLGGTANATLKIAIDNATVAAGQTSNGTTIESGGLLFVASGGTANGAIVSSGGAEIVASGGMASGTQVNSGAFDVVEAGGTDVSATVNDGGEQGVFGTARATVLANGGFEFVQAGGLASGTTVSSGAAVFDSATASGTQVKSGGFDIVESGGSDVGATVSAGGQQFVFGTARATTLGGGGFEWLESGGLASGTVVSSGAALLDSATASGTQVKSGGFDVVESGGSDVGATVSSGGVQFVFGDASATALGSMGFEYVESGGVASGTTVSSGGAVFDFGVGSGAQVKSGAYDIVESGGTDAGAAVSGGGLQAVEAGAQATGTVASGAGAQVLVLAGGTISGTTLSGGGFDIVSGTAVSTTVNNGGIEDDLGVTSATTTNSGGIQDVGGTAIGAVVMNAGTEVVVSGGTAIGTTIGSGGFMDVMSGGSVGSVTFAGGGTLQLDDSVHFGGRVAGFGLPEMLDLTDISYISGTTSGSWAQSGTSGTLTVTDGTHTANITLLGQYVGGQFHVGPDGRGGTVVTDPPVGGQLDATGGGQLVFGNATSQSPDPVVIADGGSVELVFSAAPVSFIGATGTLQLDHSAQFGGQISGFAGEDQIDLRDIVFGSQTTISYAANPDNTGGSLIVSNGGQATSLALLGNYNTSQFIASSDGQGGTLVTLHQPSQANLATPQTHT